MVQVRRYDAPPVDLAEMLRYAACRQATEEVETLARAAIEEGAGANGDLCHCLSNLYRFILIVSIVSS